MNEQHSILWVHLTLKQHDQHGFMTRFLDVSSEASEKLLCNGVIKFSILLFW